MLLFLTEDDKTRANAEKKSPQRYRHGIAICEDKAWGVPLDRVSKGRSGPQGVPSNQILRYLSIAEVQSERQIRWGLLTNGRLWRLYWQGAKSRSEQFLELDLPCILGVEGFANDLFAPKGKDEFEHWLRVFILMFRNLAFAPTEADGKSYHHVALDEGRLWEERVAKDLSGLVFKDIFPNLVQGLVANDPQAPAVLTRQYLADVKEAALILLYRLLFVLFAEDRNLLPARDDTRYDDYGMREKVRDDIARRIDERDVFSDTFVGYYNHTTQLFRAINNGDRAIGLPPYNGGLFDAARTPILERAGIPDSIFAPIIDKLSRHDDGRRKRRINYRDLSVQQLGSIYEQLLEFEVVVRDGHVDIRPNVFARKGSGSYYTPDELVRLIIERTLEPLLEERRAAFAAKAAELRSDRRAKAERIADLKVLDPANRFLDLKVCDPAMGSGHFLVSLVDYLADHILEAIADSEAAADWTDASAPYVSPVTDSIQNVRDHILEQARDAGWTVRKDQLDDRLLVRRMILKRVIFGVDKNPMAVELAKVALWLHTFTVGAPLSFLDHHLQCGDSLFGEWVRPIEDELAKGGFMFLRPSVLKARNSAAGMAKVERISDADIAEVKTSSVTYSAIEEATAPLRAFMDVKHALRWFEPRDKEGKTAVHAWLDGQFGDPLALAAGKLDLPSPGRQNEPALFEEGREVQESLLSGNAPNGDSAERFGELLTRARALAAEERFLHWEAAFPGVWDNWESAEPEGGFDAVIGNPPWDRMKLQEVEWFAARRPEIAHAARAADRKKMISELQEAGDPLAKDYALARDRAEAAMRLARKGGQYPLLAKGDINLYALFVERAMRLVSKTGVIGLLTPSGIAADKSTSEFFKKIATGGRLAALLDFENRRPPKPHFFPDVDSRFKFCAFVAGGSGRRFTKTECAFFLHSADEIPANSFSLTPEDFRAVNPNTGTAPIFRTRRDAELTMSVYSRVPVLVDRTTDPPKKTWPVRYLRMFDMTNDSALFHTAPELEAMGCYRVEGNRWKKGDHEFVPLYEGKMVQAFDHRAASVVVNPQNLNRPAQPQPATEKERLDPDWLPTPQFWVDMGEVARMASDSEWMIGFKDVTAPTNIRTMISGIIPLSGTGNTLPLILPSEGEGQGRDSQQAYFRMCAPLYLANLNSLVLDFVARQKVQGQHLNWYIVEQLPVLPAGTYETKIGDMTAAEIVREEVLKLTYTAHDMAPFARDMGYDGPPFVWDEEERRHSRARLDALYFMLYGIDDEDDVRYILDTFPIVRRNDEKAFDVYLTRDLIIGYMRAFKAGDTETRVSP